MTPVKIVTPSVGGVRLVPPGDQEFETYIATAFADNAALVSALRPYLVMVSNESDRTVVAYTILFTINFEEGEPEQHPCFFRFPDAIWPISGLPRGREILPSERRMIAWEFEIDPSLRDLDYFLRQHAEIQRQSLPDEVKSVDIALDAVIFDNGLMLGAATSGNSRSTTYTGLADSLFQCLEAKRELYKELLESSKPADTVRSIIDKLYGPKAGYAFEIRMPTWRRLAVEEAQRLLSKLGAEAFSLTIQAVLEESPFAIRCGSLDAQPQIAPSVPKPVWPDLMEETRLDPAANRPRAGDPAPQLRFAHVLSAPGSENWTVENLIGRVTAVVFVPSISNHVGEWWNQMADRFATEPIQLVCITGEDESTLQAWLRDHPMRGWILHDPKGEMPTACGMERLMCAVIDRDGRIAGFQSWWIPSERVLRGVLEGRFKAVANAKTRADMNALSRLIEEGNVLLRAEPPQMQNPGSHQPDFPPSYNVHISPTKNGSVSV